jgi:hypothetical protein
MITLQRISEIFEGLETNFLLLHKGGQSDSIMTKRN